jgi:hypothetical protein
MFYAVGFTATPPRENPTVGPPVPKLSGTPPPVDLITTLDQARLYASRGYWVSVENGWQTAAQGYQYAYERSFSGAAVSYIKDYLVAANRSADAEKRAQRKQAPNPNPPRDLPEARSSGLFGVSPVTLAIGSALVATGIAWWKSGQPQYTRKRR